MKKADKELRATASNSPLITEVLQLERNQATFVTWSSCPLLTRPIQEAPERWQALVCKHERAPFYFQLIVYSECYSPWLGSNLILKGALDEYGSENPINFASWMQYAAVPMIINFLFCWIWLQFWYLGLPKTCKKKTSKNDQLQMQDSGRVPSRQNSNGVRDVIRQQYKELGPMDCHQIGVLVLFIVLIFLWFFRKPQFMMGWSDFFKTKWVKNIVG